MSAVFWQAAAEYVGPWQPRSSTWLIWPAGVASVISAVETLPVRMPFFLASSISVGTTSPLASTPSAAL